MPILEAIARLWRRPEPQTAAEEKTLSERIEAEKIRLLLRGCGVLNSYSNVAAGTPGNALQILVRDGLMVCRTSGFDYGTSDRHWVFSLSEAGKAARSVLRAEAAFDLAR